MAVSHRQRFLNDFPKSLLNDSGAVFVGAGVSMAAGYPSWMQLLKEIGEELGVSSSDVHDLAALAQWSIQSSGGRSKIRKVIRDSIKPDRDVPDSVGTIARLPLRHIWTTNYDRLIERAFEAISRPLDTISAAADLSVPGRPGAVRLYKMHGSIDRLDDLVISTDDYELYRSKRAAFLPLLQSHLISMSVLFVGLSLTDPNIRHVLSLIRESFADGPPEHFAIVRPPQRGDFKSLGQYRAKLAQHELWAKDLERYGLLAVEVGKYSDVPKLLRLVEQRVARGRVWVSGSWPSDTSDTAAAKVYEVSELVGKLVGTLGLSLVSGAGVVVGSASISGFLSSLRLGGGWDLERRLLARPFPQPFVGHTPDEKGWQALRVELARIGGIAIFVGGAKITDGSVRAAEGVMEEAKLAEAAGAFLIPIGATGGAAHRLAKKLVGSKLPCEGPLAVRPTDAELLNLCDASSTPQELVSRVEGILRRVMKPVS